LVIARISTLNAAALNLGLLAISALACLEIYAITTKMMVLVGMGLSWFLPITAIFGGTYLLPWLLLIVIISAMANTIRLPLALLFLISGILGWNHGYWRFETIDYLDYDPERHQFRPSGYAQLVSGGINAGLIIWAIVLVVFRKVFQALSRKTRVLVAGNSSVLYTGLVCVGLLITITLIELPYRLFLNGKGLYWAGTMVVMGILIIDSLITPQRGNRPLIFFTLESISLVTIVYLLYYLTMFQKVPSKWFGINWLYVHRFITIIAGMILLYVPALILIRNRGTRGRRTLPRIAEQLNAPI